MKLRSACSQMMSCLKYLTSVRKITIPALVIKFFQRLCGIGRYWCMCAKDGDKLYLPHHSVSIYEFSVHTGHLSGRIWMFGQ